MRRIKQLWQTGPGRSPDGFLTDGALAGCETEGSMKATLAFLLPAALLLGACGELAPVAASGTPASGTSTPGTSTPGTSTPGTSTPTGGTSTPGTSTPGTSTPGTSTPAPNPPPVPNPTPTPPPSGTLRWSDPKAWPGGVLPAEGAKVTIPAGQEMLLDVSPPRLGGLTIEGHLSFAEQDLELKADWIMLHGGTLSVGAEGQPFGHRATITLTDGTPGEDVMGMGDKVLGSMMGGTLDLHGQPRLAWTRLNANAPAGATSLTLERAPDWQPGDRIVVASTDFSGDQAEVVTVQSVNGPNVTFTPALKYPHWGSLQSIAGGTVDERAEVGLLTHNVVIQGEAASSAQGFGGHIMLMDGSKGRFENVELTRMGQLGLVRRYPIHFHMLGDAGAQSYLKGVSLHDNFNRCVTIHGTNNLKVQNSVAYNTIGHCFFMEDGAETGNVLENNLALVTKKPDGKTQKAVLPSDGSYPGPASYWITNPANTLRGNVAAGGDGVGFWYALPQHPTGLSAANGGGIWPQRTPLGVFSGNVAHSYGSFGLDVDHGPRPDGTTGTAYYAPRVNPADPNSAAVPARFENFTAYKVRDEGAWLRGSGLTLSNPTLADNAIGTTFAADASGLEGGLVVGETANLGSPASWEAKGDGGRSLPKPWDQAFPIRGYQFYDGTVHATGVTFANFTPNGLRQASGLSYLRQDAFATSPRNYVQGLKFVNATPVYIENPTPGKDGDTSMVFVDRDGSVGGQAGAYITANSPLLYDGACSFQAAWNTYLCPPKPYGRLWLNAVDTIVSPGTVTVSQGSLSTALSGTPDARTSYSTTVVAGQGYGLNIAGTVPAHVRLGLNERAVGDTLRLSLPYPFEPILYRDWWVDNRNKLKKVAASALDSTGGDSYAYEGGVLSLKLVVQQGRDYAELELCQTDLCK